MTRFTLVFVLSTALGGCLSRADPGADDRYCQGLGLKVGDPTYAQCRLQLRAEDERSRVRTGRALAEAGRNISAIADSQAAMTRPVLPRRSLNCTVTTLGAASFVDC